MSTANAVLILDIDQAVTRAVLCDVVEGSARLVDVGEAVTTAGAPYFEMSIGISRAMRQLEDQSGRRLMENELVISPSRPDGDGVDRVFITGVPVEPNRIGLLSLEPGELTHVLRTAVRRTVSNLSEADDHFRWSETSLSPTSVEGWLRDSRPTTLILIAGNGPVNDWRAALEVIASVAPEYGATQGIVIADEERQQVAAEVLDDSLELSGIDPQSYHPSEISSAVESELREQYAGRLPQEPSLQAFSSGMFVDRMQGVESVAAFLHRRMGRKLAVLGTQAGTLIEVATGHGAVSVYRGDIDTGAGARSLLQLSMPDIARWVPSQMTEDELRHWLLNRSLRPHTRVFGKSDRAIAGGVVREAVSHIIRSAGVDDMLDVDLIILGRELMDMTGNDAILVTLDALRTLPSDGVVMLSVDRDGIIAALGALSAGEPDYAREVIENDFLSPLGSCIVFHGQAQHGNRIADLEIETDEGERRELSLDYGEVRCLPLPEGRTATVTIHPTSSISVGRFSAGEEVTFEGDQALHGGEFGIVLDGRGRPCELPSDNESRINTLSRWSDAFNQERD
ncbi:MAG: hypothetical protein WD401_06600 [Thermomicrobiaceae bacterium]